MDESALQPDIMLHLKQREEAKRDRHLSDAGRLAGAVSLLSQLPESEAYRRACTPAARMAEERLLLQLHQSNCDRSKVTPER